MKEEMGIFYLCLMFVVFWVADGKEDEYHDDAVSLPRTMNQCCLQLQPLVFMSGHAQCL